MRIARLALVDCISRNTSTSQVLSVLDTLVALLEDSYSDDRQATPLLETLAFVLEQFIDLEPGTECKLPTRKLWNVVRKAHFKSTNIRKVEAALKIYGALAIHSDLRVKALGKLIEMLLHPYPSVSRCDGIPVVTRENIHEIDANWAQYRFGTQLLMHCTPSCRTMYF